MASETRYHISKKTGRPNRCEATKRGCPLGEDTPHFATKEDAQAYAEQKDADDYGMFSTISKNESMEAKSTIEDLPVTNYPQSGLTEVPARLDVSDKPEHNPEFYEHLLESGAKGSQPKENHVHTRIAAMLQRDSERSNLGMLAIVDEDKDWRKNSTQEIKVFIMEDGSKAFFKPLSPKGSGYHESFGHSTLKVGLNEVRAYRLSKALGYGELVPETILTTLPDGSIGSLQKGVERIEKATIGSTPREDRTRAAIFDIIIGSQDRHHENYLVECGANDAERSRLKLIDNGFSLPVGNNFEYTRSDMTNDLMMIKQSEIDNVERVLNSPDFGGVAHLFTKAELASIRSRAKFIVETQSASINRYLGNYDPTIAWKKDPEA